MEDIEDAELGAGSGAMAKLPRSTLVPVQPQVGMEPAAAPPPASTGNVIPSAGDEGQLQDWQKVRIPIQALPERVRKVALDVDKKGDNDGHLNVHEITSALERLLESKQDVRRLQKTICIGVLAVIVALALVLAVTYWAALLAHHTEITGTSPVLKAKGTGNPIQVSSAEFTVVDGVLTIRGSESSDSGRRLAGEATVAPTGTVGVRMSMQRRKLSSTLPDEYFKELKHFEVTNDFGSSMALDISAVVRIPRRSSHCGSILTLYTPLGKIEIDGEDMTFDTDVGDVFAEAGFHVDTHGLGPTYRRRLVSSITITGLFNWIGDREWTCPDVPKPEMPKEFTMSIIRLIPCPFINQCARQAGHGLWELNPGVIESQVDGSLRVVTHQTIHSGPQGVVTISEYPSYPFQKQVTRVDVAGNTISNYEVASNMPGHLFHCSRTPKYVDTTKDTLADANFQYMGEGERGTRHFKISFVKHEHDPLFTQDKSTRYRHVQYFDDITTHKPRRIAMDDGTEMIILSLVETYGQPEYAFTAEQWDACVQEDDYFHANNTAHTVEDPRPLRSRAFGRLEMTAFIKANLNKTLVTNSSLGYTEYEAFQGANQELRAWYRDRINGTGSLVYAHGKRPVDRRLQEHRRRLKKQTTPRFSFQPYIPGTPPVPFDLRLGLTIEGSTSSLDIDGQLDAKTAPFDTPDHFALTIAGTWYDVLVGWGSIDFSWGDGNFKGGGCAGVNIEFGGLLDAFGLATVLPGLIQDWLKQFLDSQNQELVKVCIWYKELHTINDFAIDGCESVKVVIPDAIVLTGAVSVRPPYPLGGFIRFRGTYSYTTSSKCMLFGSPSKSHKKLDLQRFDLDMEYFGPGSGFLGFFDWQWRSGFTETFISQSNTHEGTTCDGSFCNNAQFEHSFRESFLDLTTRNCASEDVRSPSCDAHKGAHLTKPDKPKIAQGNNGAFGEWTQPPVKCILGYTLCGAQIVYQPNQGSGDDTAIGGLTIACCKTSGFTWLQEDKHFHTVGVGLKFPDSITSPMQYCDTDQAVRGIQLRVEGDQGGGADDTGLNEFKLKCFKLANGWSEAAADTKTLTFTSTTWGDWDANMNLCPNDKPWACGAFARIEAYLFSGDDTGINSIALECCHKYYGDPLEPV